MSETVIVAALRGGNIRRAVELILDGYHDQLYQYCAVFVSASAAPLAYQRVLLATMEALPDFRAEVSVRAWLFGIARNVVLTIQRQTSAEPFLVPQTFKDDWLFLQDSVDLECRSCLEALEAAPREVLELALWHDLTLAEVAHITGRTVFEVRRLVVTGLSQLCGELPRQGGMPS